MDLPKITRENQWTCRWCHKKYVVPCLARDCEADHEADFIEEQEPEELSDAG